MIIKFIATFYILFHFQAIALGEGPELKKQKTDFFIKSGEELIYLKDKNGTILELKPLRSIQSQINGLSGIKRNQLKMNQGAIFIYKSEGKRSFWMPDTYFDLAIIFLDQNLSITYLEKKALAHPGRQEPPLIFRTKSVVAKYVVELPADNPLVFSLEKGDRFKFLK